MIISPLFEDTYELSPMQQGMLFDSLQSPADIYCMIVAYRLQGPLDREAFVPAWQHVVDRHPILRTSFEWDENSEPRQRVHRAVALDVLEEDWQRMSASEQDRRLTGLLRAESRRGFDLRQAPLMRLALLRYGRDVHHFVLAQHHLLMDGSCKPLLFHEAFAAYDAIRRGERPSLPPATPYRDYIVWLREQDLSAAEAFWRAQLRGFTEPTPIRALRPAESRSSTGYGEHEVRLDEGATAALTRMARRNRLTLNSLVSGVWALVLAHASGQRDVVFGATVNARPASLHEEPVLGLFINTLPLRIQIAPEQPLPHWFRAIQSTLASARDFDFAALWRIQRWSDVRPGSPLFETILVFENNPGYGTSTEQYGDIAVTSVLPCTKNSIPLTVRVVPGSAIAIQLLYDRGRFASDTIRRMGDQVAGLLSEIGRVEERSLQCLLAHLDETDSRRDPTDALAFRVPAMERDVDCVHRLFEARVGRLAGVPAVICEDELLTYGALNTRANRLGRHLQRLGIGPDALVAVCLPRSVDLIVSILATLKAGGAYVPIDPQLPAARREELLAESRASVVITESRFISSGMSGARIVALDTAGPTIGEESSDNLDVQVTPAHLAYVLFTSGSTGRPKGVAIEHRQLVNYTLAISQRLELPHDASCATVTTLASDLGNTAIFPALLTAGCLHLVTERRASDPQALAEYFGRHPVDMLKIVPSHLRALLVIPYPAGILPQKRLVLGGEAAEWDLVDRVRTLAPGCRVFNHYGPTETTVGATVFEVEPDAERPLSLTVPIGRPLPHASAHVVDTEGRLVPVGTAGELLIGGAGVARGYLHAPELTRERFITNPLSGDPSDRVYRTGDLVGRLPSGDLEFLGRLDDQVKIRGYRVEPGEIAAVIRRHPNVRDAVVLVRVDGAEKRLAAFVVTAPTPHNLAEITAYLATELPAYMVPASLVALDALPLTANGKIDRTALLTFRSPAPVSQPASRQPSTPWELCVAEVWRGLLDADEIALHDNFYDLGGHSLLAIQAVAALEARTGLKIPPRELAFHTLKQFAAMCDARLPLAANAAPIRR